MWSPPTLAEKNQEKQLTLHTIKLPSGTIAHCYPSSSPLSALGAEPFTWRRLLTGTELFCCATERKIHLPPEPVAVALIQDWPTVQCLQVTSDLPPFNWAATVHSIARRRMRVGLGGEVSWKRGVCAKFSLQQWRALCFSFLRGSHTFLTFDTQWAYLWF